MERHARGRFDQQLMAVDSFDSLEGSGSRSKNSDRVGTHPIEELRNLTRHAGRATRIAIRDHDPREGSERRVEHCLPISGLARVEILEPLRHRQLERVVVWEIAL